jgi:hypothetical protein
MLFGTGWPEKEEEKLVAFASLSQKQEWPADANQQAVTLQ